jgi:hypothetical protein
MCHILYMYMTYIYPANTIECAAKAVEDQELRKRSEIVESIGGCDAWEYSAIVFGGGPRWSNQLG